MYVFCSYHNILLAFVRICPCVEDGLGKGGEGVKIPNFEPSTSAHLEIGRKECRGNKSRDFVSLLRLCDSCSLPEGGA